MREQVEQHLAGAQDALCAAIGELDDRLRVRVEPWQRDGGGGGRTRILTGAVIEQAAVNTSSVWGDVPDGLRRHLGDDAEWFFATGLSVIVHPRNPHAPTFHANVRYLEAGGHAWFGGGVDLTPHYLHPADAAGFHRRVAELCGRHTAADHPAWKDACDRYFRLPHRGEARGVGGVFTDREPADAATWAFHADLAVSLADLYLPILERRRDSPYGSREVHWQELRRGRYVEFNLVWDRGTRFGLESGGRTESILASLPPRARWDEGFVPDPGGPEEELVVMLKGPPRDWLTWTA